MLALKRDPSAERLSPSPGRRLREPTRRRRVALPGPGGVPDGPGAGPRTTNDRFRARDGSDAVHARGQVHPLRAPVRVRRADAERPLPGLAEAVEDDGHGVGPAHDHFRARERYAQHGARA